MSFTREKAKALDCAILTTYPNSEMKPQIDERLLPPFTRTPRLFR